MKDFYSPPGIAPLSSIPPGEEWVPVGLIFDIRAASCLQRQNRQKKIVMKQMKALGIAKAGLSFDLDASVTLQGTVTERREGQYS